MTLLFTCTCARDRSSSDAGWTLTPLHSLSLTQGGLDGVISFPA